jgi:hypothetical protein
MAGRYRALLIGNSTYPADEHNLQTLKGPVKDIAALNRALIDPQAGLFADADVTLVPEATSSRVIRVMGGFFATAGRDDVLLVYFSGHGKLDQNGRLHLCMQDTESTDLLSTAVSSARINEFADATHARNVVIVLDCCHAGAFRGGELGDAVAGPGRYVLTSCRGTQLANDATADNGTSLFTQHLVDGLLGAADDQDRDGWITFSDVYAYVNRRLREAGKQIPQQRVSGDGDLHLARSSPAAPVTAGSTQVSHAIAAPPDRQSPSPLDAVKTAADSTSAQTRPAGTGRRRNVLLAAGAAVVIVVAAAITVTLLAGGNGGHSPGSTGTSSHTASGPWRLLIQDVSSGTDPGCSVTLTDSQSGQTRFFPNVYSQHISYQIQAGSFRWQVTSPGTCNVTSLAGPGTGKLPFDWLQGGDTDAFAVASGTRVAVKVTDFDGSQTCELTLRDAANGLPIASETATPGQGHDTAVFDTGGHPAVYLSELTCHILVSSTH